MVVALLVLMTVGLGSAVDNVTTDISKLTAAIEAADTKVGNAVAGIELGQYPPSAINSFKVAIATAQTVVNDEDATQEDVNQAVANLEAAEKKFDAAKITTIDKSALTAAIIEANTKVGNAVATDLGQYPQSAINEFNEAIATAQTVADDEDAIQEDVNRALTDLEAAEKKFDAAKGTDVPLEPLVTDLKETETGPSWINWSWVNPAGTDFSHLMIYINDTFVTNTSDSSISSYNATGLSDGVTYTISIRTVNISGSISSIPTIDSATTIKLPGIYNLSGTNITPTSITLIWEASNDTSRVEIHRNYMILGNASGAKSYVDGNLSSGTTYNYTLIPYNEDGLEGKALTVSLDTVSSHSSGGGGSSTGKKSSSSGSGGGASSSEDFKNIALKDTDSQYLRANANATYKFTNSENDIQSIGFYSLKNSGEVTSTIEVLNNRSKLVNSSPEGLVYQYINIWIGKSGFATSDNIKDSRIRFRVNNTWVRATGVAPTDIRLQRYNQMVWEVLPTALVSDTTDYAIFESQVLGFSPFAITAEKVLTSPANSDPEIEPVQETGVSTEQKQPEKSGIWTFFEALLMVEVVAVGYEYRKRRKKE